MTKVALPVTGDEVTGPGEGEKVKIFDVENDLIKLVEEYPNPALHAVAARGAHMLKSALDKGAQVFLVTEMGPRSQVTPGKGQGFPSRRRY